jgi:menaquinone-9 beta-reductase
VALANSSPLFWTEALGLVEARGEDLKFKWVQEQKATRVGDFSRENSVFVIGGGPAGLAAAIAASQKGFAVTVADGVEPAIDKPCGEGMMPATQAALSELGVELPTYLGYRFRGIRFVQGAMQVAADFPEGQGTGVRRTLLHELLIRRAEQCGVKLLWRTPVLGIAPDGVRVGGRTIPVGWIVGADGGHSRVRRWSNLDCAVTNSHRFASRRHYRVRPWSQFTEIYWGLRVQAYVTPISNGEVCIVTVAESKEDAGFERALRVLPALRARLADAELGSRERGAITAMHSLARVWRGHVALVGDASGGVDAITGEGLRLAFRQAQALAEAMVAGDLGEYGRVHRQLARRPLWMGRMMLQLGRCGALRSRTFRLLQRNPELFACLLAIHAGQGSARDVVRTGAQLGWQFLAG